MLTNKEQLDDHIQSAQALLNYMQNRLTQTACKGQLNKSSAVDLMTQCNALARRFKSMGEL